MEILQEEHLENEDLKRETVNKEKLDDKRLLEINCEVKGEVSNNLNSVSQVSQAEDFLTHDE